MLNATLEEIMSEDVVTIKEESTVAQAAHILLRFRINGILVVDGKDRNRVTAVFTTADLLQLLNEAMSLRGHRIEKLRLLADLPLKEVVSGKVVKVQKEARISKVIALMYKKEAYTIPVYDGDTLVGVVGRHDILNAAFA